MATPSSSSIVKGVRKLEPARIATAVDGRAVRVERYWDVEFQPDENSSEDELVEQLRELLVEAVRLHQIGDVPIVEAAIGVVLIVGVIYYLVAQVSKPARPLPEEAAVSA